MDSDEGEEDVPGGAPREAGGTHALQHTFDELHAICRGGESVAGEGSGSSRAQQEQARRDAWLKLPRSLRSAIRRLHVMIGHKPKDVMIQIMKGAKVDPETIKG